MRGCNKDDPFDFWYRFNHKELTDLGLLLLRRGLALADLLRAKRLLNVTFQVGVAGELGFGSADNPFVLEPLTVVSPGLAIYKSVPHGAPRPAAGTMMSVPEFRAKTGAVVAARASATKTMIKRRIEASLGPFVNLQATP